MQECSPYIAFQTWDEVRDDINKICPRLCNIIDAIDPDNSYKLIRVKYPYGAKVLENVVFNLPAKDGQIVPLNNLLLPKGIQKQLSYSPMPLGILVSNAMEIYRELNERVFTVSYFGSGLDIGIWEYQGWTTPYSISSGARSVYMLPKISSTRAHKRLKREYEVTYPVPKQLSHHWHIFRQIANSPKFQDKWYCDILFLTTQWADSLEKNKTNNKQWRDLDAYLLEKGWQHSGYARRKSILDLVWQTFAQSLSNKGLKYNEYIIDTLKHLVFIGTETVPATAPFIGDDLAGPINEIQQVYQNCYGLNEYIPTVMVPKYLSLKDDRPVYYSLANPTLLESYPKTRNITSTMDTIRELMDLIQHCFSEGLDYSLTLGDQAIQKTLANLKFEFFHHEMYAYGQAIRPTCEMPEKDKNLLYPSCNNKNAKFADSGCFVHGCTRISALQNQAG